MREPICAVLRAAAQGSGGSLTAACFEHAERSLPDHVAEARRAEHTRLENVVRVWTKSFEGSWDDFGEWETDGTRTSLRKIMAGLKALQILPEGDPQRPPAEFPRRVEHWLQRQAIAHKRAGTDTRDSPLGGSAGDYDFYMIQILELVYHFKDASELLTDDAIWALLHNERYQAPGGRGRRSRERIPEIGNWPHRMMFDVMVQFPETENHVLMVNVWAYLVNQWLEQNPRDDRRVRRYFEKNPRAYRNEGSWLERVLLSVVARPLHSGFFETNGRPYQAYSLRALQLLYSYADDSRPGGRRLKLAAKNALDYAAVKFAFQSFEGKRLGPSRRNYRYRKQVGVYQGDYVPYLFGVLTGAHVYDDDPTCRGSHCAYRNAQARGFALESALSRYRVPDLIWDFMLHPDNHRTGHGVWVRMQPRFSERHYLQGKWPRYPGRTPNLERALARGHAAIEPAPELYFITQSFMNSAGGRTEHYAGQDAWLPRRYLHANDLFSKPSVLLWSGDIGYWRSLAELEETTLAFRGNAKHHYESNNTGVYKNLVYGYSTDDRSWPMAVPSAWSMGQRWQWGALSLASLDLTSNNLDRNPKLGLYVVLGRFSKLSRAGGHTGFWEVIPESAFTTAQELVECVIDRNREHAYEVGGPYDYRLCLSGDKLRFNPTYGLDDNAFLSINDAESELRREHIDLGDQRALRALPLLEAREVDEHYRYTGTVYAYAAGDGRVTIENPHLEQRLVLDSSEPERPRRWLEQLW